ncbi:proton-coupled amino acid transporter-like protein pathetic [Anabrus simplex]|uniref:proton-coupled amino acid transporter-like protein pathetic n=1 Tax=Anabrus simplex TaxID=316456 RepID=UPI0034DD135F
MGEKMEKNAENTKSQSSLNFSSTAQLADGVNKEKGSVAYNPFEERNLEHPTSSFGALAHILKCSLGSGILAMPNAFKNAGLAFGLVGTVLVGIICTHCVHILVKSSHLVCFKAQRPSLTFAETAEMAFSTGPESFKKWAPFAKKFVNTALVATYYTALSVYVVFIAESFEQVIEYYVDDLHLDIRVYIVILLVPLSLLCLIRNLKYLVPFSMLANCFILVGFGITLYYMFSEMPSISDRDLVAPVHSWPLFFSTVIFAMEGIGAVMPVENSMKNPGFFLGCPGILNISMTTVVTLYAVIGFFGYMQYGEETKGSVTLNLPVEEVAAQVVKILVALAIMFTYPLQFYVGTEIVLSLVMHRIQKRYENLFENSYRIMIVILTVGFAVAVPKLGPIIGLVGAICFSILGLFCPAIIEIAACWDGGLGIGRWRLYKNIIIAILSGLALISGTYSSIEDIIKTYG